MSHIKHLSLFIYFFCWNSLSLFYFFVETLSLYWYLIQWVLYLFLFPFKKKKKKQQAKQSKAKNFLISHCSQNIDQWQTRSLWGKYRRLSRSSRPPWIPKLQTLKWRSRLSLALALSSRLSLAAWASLSSSPRLTTSPRYNLENFDLYSWFNILGFWF